MLAKRTQDVSIAFTTATALALLVVTVTAATVPARAASALAPPVQEKAAQKAPQTDDSQTEMELAAKSHLIDIALPAGARRAVSSRDLSKLRASVASNAASAQDEKAAHAKGDPIKDDQSAVSREVAQFEILQWSGKTAETARPELSKRLKSQGYTVTEGATIMTEDGRVTTLDAKLIGPKSGSTGSHFGGVWVESKTDGTTLVWGCVDAKAAPDTKTASATSK